METKPRFKNSFNVQGTFGELMHFKEEVIKMGWGQSKNSINDYSEKLIAFQFAGSGHKHGGKFWNIIDLNGNTCQSLSTPEGWKRALSLAEEKEEEVPEYIYFDSSLAAPSCYKIGKIYKVNHWFVESEKIGCSTDLRDKQYSWVSSTAEAFARQELLEEAKRRYPVGTVFAQMYGLAISHTSSGIFEIDKDNDIFMVTEDDYRWFVYRHCRWATIIPEEKTPTKEEIERVLNHLIKEHGKNI